MPGLICVCLKPSWRTEVRLRLSEGGAGIRAQEALPTLSPADRAALALALRLSAGQGSRLLALSFAPAASGAPVLREALAQGAHEVLRVWSEDWPQDYPARQDGSAATTRAAAEALAGVLGPRQPLLVLAGERSNDAGHGAFGLFLAAALRATPAQRVTAAALEGPPEERQCRVVVRLPRGYGQELLLPLPAVLGVAAQAERAADPDLPMWLAAQRTPIAALTVAASAPAGARTQLRVPLPRVKSRPQVRPQPLPAAEQSPDQPAPLSAEQRIAALVALPEGKGSAQMVQGSPSEQAAAAVALLRERGFVDAAQ